MKLAWLAIGVLGVGLARGAGPADPFPVYAQTVKPWTRWWWPGSAVEHDALRAQLEAFAAAGIGGVELTPIYGVRGAQSRELEFLSPRWVEALQFTAAEARRLGLGIDMATGTGWPFGGPWVEPAQGASSLALVDGALAGKPTGMKVKRAAPGGAGLVLDPYSTTALDGYLAHFTAALQPLPSGAIRAQFHDSFEYYEASWSPELPREFQQLNGYDIQDHARELAGDEPVDGDTLGRLKGDYRRTLAKMHLDYVNRWVDWSHAHGFRARHQAHGAPGNLLDLYAAADIPETESYGMTPLPIPGLRAPAGEINPDPDPPEGLIARFASSAAHVSGRPLASSETLTWLRENFREAPWAAKPQLDRLFAAGINHVFYHGMTYSPADAEWPGWFFYAASQLGPNNPLWSDYAAMNAYVERVQTALTRGSPDNDVLLYWPFDELLDDAEGTMRQFGVHQDQWLSGSSTGRLALELLHAGISFDFVSDAQVMQLGVKSHDLVARGGAYRVLVVPPLRRMSTTTLARIGRLAELGARVVFSELPSDVPGFGNLDARRAELQKILARPEWRARVAQGPIAAFLASLGVRREGAGSAGLAYTRRSAYQGHEYFFANLTCCRFDGWLELGVPAVSASMVDPLDGRTGTAAVARRAGRARVYLQLEAGQSMLVRTSSQPPARGQARWQYLARAGEARALDGVWHLEFLRGGPALPAARSGAMLGSWTRFEDPAIAAFSGTARYSVEFDAPEIRAEQWLLDLGDVREAARVTLNGIEVGRAWSLPFVLRLAQPLRPVGNLLEIEVSNLPANRIRDLDRRRVDWKIMLDANLVSLQYKPFDASGWELAPSGLPGPVRLVPLELVRP